MLFYPCTYLESSQKEKQTYHWVNLLGESIKKGKFTKMLKEHGKTHVKKACIFHSILTGIPFSLTMSFENRREEWLTAFI